MRYVRSLCHFVDRNLVALSFSHIISVSIIEIAILRLVFRWSGEECDRAMLALMCGKGAFWIAVCLASTAVEIHRIRNQNKQGD